MLLESSCATEEVAGPAATGADRDGWGVASRQGKERDAAAVGRRCETALGRGEVR
jgi:hypothetical protein